MKTLANIERFSITGSAFADDFTGGAHTDNLFGGDGADHLSGLGGDDTLQGANGNDTLDGGEGNDGLYGGAGDDVMNGGIGDDWLQAQAGHDVLNGGDGIDMADLGFITFTSPLNFTLGDGVLAYSGGSVTLSAMDRINIGGSTGVDTITGGGYDDSIGGNSGNDFLYGLSGNDQLGGGNGDDTLEGGEGNDRLIGDVGNDVLRGGNGDDIFYLTPGGGIYNPEYGNDTWDGGAGTDKAELFFYLDGQTSGVNFTLGNVTVTTYYGTKTLISIEAIKASGTNFADNLTGGTGDDEFVGNGGNDVLNGLAGNDRFDGGDGNDAFNGGAGFDTAVLDFYNVTTNLTFTVGNQTVTTARGQKTLNSIEAVVLTGGSGNDVITGGDYNDQLAGGAGSDTLYGGGGDDVLDGGVEGATPDRLIGGAGNDRLEGYADTNAIAVFSGPRSNYTVTLDGNGYIIVTDNVGTDGTDTLESIRTLEFADRTYTAQEATGYSPVALGGTVWNDANRDSGFFGGETGVSGVAVSLFKDNGDGVFSAGDIQIATTMTGADGSYSFANLEQGSYIVCVDAANFDAGGVLAGMVNSLGGGDPDDDVDHDDNGLPGAGFVVSRAITLNAGSEPSGDINNTLDFGFAAAINSAPVNSLGGTIGTGEDAIQAWLSGMSISDADADAATDDIRVTFAVEHGTLAIRSDVTGGITASDIVSQDGDTIVVEATLNQINAMLAATNGLTYSPDPDFNGNDSLTVTSNDMGHDGLDPGLSGDATSEEDVDVRTIIVSAVNDAPAAVDNSDSVTVGDVLTFAASDFSTGMTDPEGDAFAGVKITTLPTSGTMKLNGLALSHGATITLAQLNAGQLTYEPAAGSGDTSPSFTFQVQDNGGTANGGFNLDQSPNTFTIDVIAAVELTLGNRIFFDANSSGVYDAGDGTINGVALTLFADTNGNGAYDAGTDVQVATTVTAGGGFYSFGSLSAGDYLVRVDSSNFTGDGSLVGRTISPSGQDPDNNWDNDSNGILVGGVVVSPVITLSQNAETTADGSGQFNINNTLDFGFVEANIAPAIDLDGDDSSSVGIGYASAYTEGGAAAAISDTDVIITDANAADDIVSATITITNPETGDKLNFGILPATVSVDPISTDTVVVLIATPGTSAADFEAAIEAVTFSSTSDNPTDGGTNTARSITVVVNDGQSNSNTATATVTVADDNADAPSGTSSTVTATEDIFRLIEASDLGFADADGTFASVTISGVTGGDIYFDADGSAGAGEPVIEILPRTYTAADLAAGKVSFRAPANANGSGIGTITFAVTDDDGNTDGSPNMLTVDVTAVNDVPVAQPDSVATAENAVGTGNLLADNGSGPDSDADGGPTISEVNGSPSDVGNQIVLASGALLTVNADGTYSYDPNGAFDSLTAVGSGAVNTSATDTFTYTLAGGATATVTVTINGVAGIGDELRGDGTDNFVVGTPQDDLFLLHQGGNDTAHGLGGDDGFYFGAALTGADFIDGGAGDDDQVGLQGNYASLTLNAANFAGIETFALIAGNETTFGDPGTNLYDYNITTTGSFDRNIIVNGNRLRVGEDFTFDGSAELTGSFTFYGGFGIETLTGGAGNDGFYFGPDGRFSVGDRVSGGGGNDNQLGLRGDYTIDFNAAGFAGSLTNIQTIALLSDMDPNFTQIGDGEFDYSITLSDAMLAAGQQLTVSGVGLGAMESMAVNGSAETNGSLRLIGGKGNDVLIGGALADTIFGGLRGDTLTGGAGADQFVYTHVAQSNSAERDGIQDFVSGTDKLNFSGIDANTAVAGDQAFSFVGQSQFTGTAGELRMENISLGGPIWMTQGDTNGDGVSDVEVVIVLAQGTAISAGDFFL